VEGIKFANRDDEQRYKKLVMLRSQTSKQIEAIDREVCEILRRAEWSLEAIMRREG